MSKGFITRLLLVALILTTALTAVGCSGEAPEEVVAAEDYVAVETEVVIVDSIANTTGFNGRIAANEELMIIPKTVGVVSTVNVQLGDRVTKNEILFTLEQEDISKSMEQSLNTLNTTQLNYELTKEKIENAKLNLERNQDLYKQGAISKAQLEQSEIAASDKQLEVAEAQVRQAEIAYQQAQSGFDNTVVRAPMAGIVSTINVKVGQIATNSQAAVVLVDTESVYMQLNVVEGVVNRLQLGQEAQVKVPAAQEAPLTAVIDYISPTADARSQLYPIKIYLANPDGNIRPGMNGEARLSVDRIDSAIVVKSSAVLDKNGVKVVYVLQEDKAVERVVEVGLDTGDFVEIKSGLEAGEEIIIKGQHYVADGQTVKVVRGE